MRTILLLFLINLVANLCLSQPVYDNSGWCQRTHNVNASPWNAAVQNMKDAVFLVEIPFRRPNQNDTIY